MKGGMKTGAMLFDKTDSEDVRLADNGRLAGRTAGFTLLELMVSIAIIGIIILIITGAMRLGFRSVNAGERKIESLERIRSSLALIGYQIQSAMPLIITDNDTKKYSFTGEKTSLQFPTNYSIWGGEKGYVTVTYSIDSDNRGKKTLYASESMIGLSGAGETKLLEAFDDISFEYFYKDPTMEEGEWVEQWTDENSMPEKIRVRLLYGARDLSIIIPMRVKASTPPTQAAPGSTTPLTPATQPTPVKKPFGPA